MSLLGCNIAISGAETGAIAPCRSIVLGCPSGACATLDPRLPGQLGPLRQPVASRTPGGTRMGLARSIHSAPLSCTGWVVRRGEWQRSSALVGERAPIESGRGPGRLPGRPRLVFR